LDRAVAVLFDDVLKLGQVSALLFAEIPLDVRAVREFAVEVTE
jgi:hypothetical protein